ncbi:MAG TPA: hypothetical protein EYP10_13180, partial [Armatimonadetes bacterium]|nr:hypothetical protein [Armatimonadota bacterium]
GKVLWRRAGAQVNRLRSVTLCASGNRVFYQNGAQVVCLELKSGRQVWSATAPPLRVVHDDIVICANRESIVALSAKTGKVLWIQHPLLASIRDAFIINGTLWLGGFKEYQSEKKRKRGPAWGPYYATQRSLETGEVLKHIEPENPGHHHRCWRNKATDRYILAGRRGVEFIDLETGEVLWHNWVRGVCRYGIMPSNGLLYAPPHACGCYIAAKLEGFYALASGALPSLPPAQVEDERLERGAVYGRVGNPKSSANASEWVTYRHDAQRSGVTSTSVPSALRIKWRTTVGGKLTSLTVADGKVFVSSVDEHRVCALDANSGRLIWDFIAGGRVDSPPTVYKGMAIFGCHDGYVYSVRISDGALVWRFRAARAQRRIIVRGQLESASPVFGSVLVKNGVAYFTAGRSSYLDGGIDLYRIDAETGKPLSRTVIYSPDPKTGKQPKQYGPAYMPGALADILTTDGEYVYLRDSVFDMKGQMQQSGKPHLFTLTGFLDETWAHRSYWIFGTRCS